MKMHTGAPSASREGPLTWETDISYSDPRTTNSPRPFGDRTVVPKPGSIRAVENILDTPNQDNLKTNPVFPSFSNSYPIYEPYNSQFQNQNVSFPTEGLYNNFLLNSTNAGRSFNNTYDYSEMKDYPNANIYAPLPQMPYRYMDINAMGELADWSFRGHFSTYNGYTNNYIPGNPSEALERNGQYWRYIQSQNHPQQFHMANLQNYQSAFAMRERGIPPPPEDFHYFNSPRRAPINQWAYMNSSNYLPMSLMDGDVEPIAQPLFQQPDSHFRSFASSDQTVQREPLFVDSLNERLLRPCANAESTEYTNQFKNEDKPSQVDFTPQPEVSGPAPVSNNDTKTTPQDEKADETHDKTLSPNSIKAASARRRERMTYNNHQLLTLEYEFKRANFLQREKRFELSVRLGLTERQIKIWFQNRRMKLKRDAAKSLRANAASSPSFSEPHQTLKVIPEDPTAGANSCVQHRASSARSRRKGIPRKTVVRTFPWKHNNSLNGANSIEPFYSSSPSDSNDELIIPEHKDTENNDIKTEENESVLVPIEFPMDSYLLESTPTTAKTDTFCAREIDEDKSHSSPNDQELITNCSIDSLPTIILPEIGNELNVDNDEAESTLKKSPSPP